MEAKDCPKCGNSVTYWYTRLDPWENDGSDLRGIVCKKCWCHSPMVYGDNDSVRESWNEFVENYGKQIESLYDPEELI